MKKILFLSIILIFSFFYKSSAQARLGSTKDVILKEFKDLEYKTELKSKFYEGQEHWFIKVNFKLCVATYFLDKDDICIYTIIKPKSQGSLNYFVEDYNKKYVIVSDKKWRMYTKEGIAYIELVFGDNGNYYFLWSINDE